MRTTALTVAGALTLVTSMAAAQGPWGKVKSWTGSVTIEATDTRKREGLSSTLTYKATGEFTISDDMMGDGDHMMWPMPNPETATDPAKYAAAYEPWQARVVGSYEANGVDEAGQPFSVKCSAENQKASRLGVTIDPSKPEYVFSVAAPEALFKCTGASGWAPNNRLQQTNFTLNGPRGEPGPVSGTKTFTVETSVIKISFSMKPAK